MKKLLPLLCLAACSREMPRDQLLDILNQRAPLVAHIGPVTKVDVLSTAKAAAGVGNEHYSCEVRLMHVTGQKGSTYVSFLRRDAAGALDSS